MATFCGIEAGLIRNTWADATLAVTLDQSLILALEDETGPGPVSGWPRAVCVAADMISPETHSVTRVRRIKVFILIPVLFVA